MSNLKTTPDMRRFQADQIEKWNPPKLGDWNIPKILRDDGDEIERLTAESKADKIRLADMEATCEFLHETEADNERLQARVKELEAENKELDDLNYIQAGMIAEAGLAATEQETE